VSLKPFLQPNNNMMLNTPTAIFFKEYVQFSPEILPLAPTAECPVDNNTTFGILVLGTFHGNQQFSSVPG